MLKMREGGPDAPQLPGAHRPSTGSKVANRELVAGSVGLCGKPLLAEQLPRAHGPPERNPDSQLEEEDGP